MKIRYSYNKYNGYPEATEISKFRGILLSIHYPAVTLVAFCLFALLIHDFESNWYIGIPGILFCGWGYVYLILFYNKITERKIAKAIERQDEMERNSPDAEYICLFIFRFDDYKKGQCEKCSEHSEKLRKCWVETRYERKVNYLCDSCIERYLKNQTGGK